MSYESSAAEVAEDYRQALEDLTTNVRFEISNLTMIAREQTEHAQVISEVLQDHILKAPAHKKLPALYVLDSIVKNVGTPYTLFFGAKLYQTFMEAYAAVDGQVRRKMDEMLRTWKEPVPGSLDKRPVFAPEVTQPIESALMKARTSALQAQQGRGRGRPGAPYRETPTPPVERKPTSKCSAPTSSANGAICTPASIVQCSAAFSGPCLLAGMPRPPMPNMNANQLDATALKQQYQPHLIASIYEQLGPQCTQCGRRFKTDEEGRKKKMAHMDWHFKAHQRLAEAEKRGQHRSWYVDNNDWLKSREAVDVDHPPSTGDASSSPGKEKKEAKPKYIPVPDASSRVNSVCPICQEKFENKWLDTAQEWVWLDTILVGNRAYHYSCHAEATQARGSTPTYSRSTPEPVHRKRKAEGDHKSHRGRVKAENRKWETELDY
ncbi:hypothetical protein K4K58_002934 [Colletotrichum sp. SAR11_239]|nr:hypothetical protein K4K58_002934 [Colletotrichum sp. SAR11_239]